MDIVKIIMKAIIYSLLEETNLKQNKGMARTNLISSPKIVST